MGCVKAGTLVVYGCSGFVFKNNPVNRFIIVSLQSLPFDFCYSHVHAFKQFVEVMLNICLVFLKTK